MSKAVRFFWASSIAVGLRSPVRLQEIGSALSSRWSACRVCTLPCTVFFDVALTLVLADWQSLTYFDDETFASGCVWVW